MRKVAASIFHDPRSVAVFGASENPDKIGGRPIHHMKTHGFGGSIFPINPNRTTVQGLAAYSSLSDAPSIPDVAVVAVAGAGAVDAVRDCARLGVAGCVVLSSGFAETHDSAGAAMQNEMVRIAHESGMRLVGPNAQGLANIATGAILSFSTMFIEAPTGDGSVAVVSQSGGMSAVAYGLLRERGVGVRYMHGTGNDSDVNVFEMISAVLDDPGIRVVLMYAEGVSDAAAFEVAARKAAVRGIPIVALVGGLSENGARAVQSHTGSLASAGVVVDAFLERLGVRRVSSMTELIESVDLYISGATVSEDELAIISSSGAMCVLASDYASEHGLGLSEFSAHTETALTRALPHFATAKNPVDITGALLTNSGLLQQVFDCFGEDDSSIGAYLFSLPVAGRGYDIEGFASTTAEFIARLDRPLAVVTPQGEVAKIFRSAGVPVFGDEAHAIRALAGYIAHKKSMTTVARSDTLDLRRPVDLHRASTLNEADSLAVLAHRGDVVEHLLVKDEAEAAEAFARFDGRPVVLKGCTSSVTHKTEYGLVALGSTTPEAVADAASRILQAMVENDFAVDGLLIEPMLESEFEVMVGSHRDPTLGSVVVVGAGGKYIEALPDFKVLLPPFERVDVIRAIESLRLAPLLHGTRGDAAVDITSWVDLAMAVGDLMISEDSVVESLDANPVLLVRDGTRMRAVIADAVVIVRDREAST
jgi:acyl-CoA synthetase (NDP forming)